MATLGFRGGGWPYPEVADLSNAQRVFLRSMATVMGPTPPGTGVRAEAIRSYLSHLKM
jgi:hypothetical protein